MTYRIQLRKDTAGYWEIVDPVLAAGEPGFETDTSKLKIGNGTDSWNDLPYVSADLNNYATLEYVQSASANAVSYLVDSAPSALNTLNELAAALNDDSNFSNTITNSLAAKLDASSASTTYLTQANASSTYLTQTSASTTYLTQSSASTSYISKVNGTVTTATPSSSVVRNITLSTSQPSGGNNGDIWMVYV